MITIHDRVFGIVSLNEPVLEEIIAVPAMQRLRHISQAGISGLLGISPNYSRFEHSLGVMLLLRHIGAPLKEQIAGLLHDISHTAFSHVVDYVYGEHEVSYHERMWHKVVERSRIPLILARYGYDWREMEAERGEFTLLEQPQPLLCADRVDYFLRTIVPADLGTAEHVSWLLAHLVPHEGMIVVDDPEAARWMADTYLRMDEIMWSSPREVALYWVLARAMRQAAEQGYLLERDWYGTDRELWKKLHRIRDPKIRRLLSYVRADTVVVVDGQEHDFVTQTKVRAIDPPLLLHEQLVPLSHLDEEFAARRAAHVAARSRPMALLVTKPRKGGTDEQVA